MSILRLTQLTIAAGLGLHLSCWAIGPVASAESLKPNDVVVGPIKIGRRTVVLPAGTWQLITSSERNSSTDGTAQSPTLLSLEFQELRNGRLTRLLQVTATKFSRTVNWLDEPCKSQGDSYWIDDRRRGIRDQFCLRVGFKSGVVDGARGDVFQAWARDMKSKSIGYSPEMPFVMVTRYTPYDYLQMTVSFDPALSGIPPSQNPARTFNEWNAAGIAQRPANAKFFDALVAWSPTYAAAVQRAFDGEDGLAASDYGEPILPVKP